MSGEERDVQAFCNSVFRGELTLVGKINFLMHLARKYPMGDYAGIADAIKRQSLMAPEERERVLWDSWHAIVARRGGVQ